MTAAKYKKSLVDMMQYLDQPQEAYNTDTALTQQQLGALTNTSITKFVPEPQQGHDLPSLASVKPFFEILEEGIKFFHAKLSDGLE
ncbi:hypothetical protein IV203_003678 [Nitzschia inconspicua]|uniref:Uncharacterized protein n=1 Tax=Nitzschia inconspicua TaxID=303405 RepID=A0A9K3L2S8_9STRA|nr:hypothetical protein IV203_003678 [Nitzschia inconspicua]